MLLTLVKDRMDLTQLVPAGTTLADLLPAVDAVADAAFLLGLPVGVMLAFAGSWLYVWFSYRRRV